MSNKENPREVQASLGKKYITEKRFPSQEGKSPRNLTGKLIRVLSTLGVIASPFLPLDAPTNVSAQSQSPSSSKELGYTPLFPHGEMVKYAHDSHDFKPASNLSTPNVDLPKLNPEQFVTYSGGGFTATRIHGDGAPTDLSYIFVGQDYPDDQKLLDTAQIYAQNLLDLEPFKPIKDRISISVLHRQSTPSLGVSWSTTSATDVLGDSQKVQKLIDTLHLSLGSFQEARILVYDLARYAAAEYVDPQQPNIYSYGAMTEANLRAQLGVRGSVAHMEGHATGGAGEGNFSTNHYGNEPNIYYNCLTADQIPVRWKGIPGAPTGPSPEIEGCGNTKTGAFKEVPVSWMSHINNGNSYGPVTLWYLTHRMDGAPSIYYVPTLLEPADGVIVNGLGTNLKFTPSDMTRQFQVQVIPYNSDGPGINMIIGDPKQVQAAEFSVAAPQLGAGPYIMLPDMSYTWRVRRTSAAKPVGENDPVWSDWAERKFRTPKTSSNTLSLPARSSLASLPETPFVWVDDNKSNFYYEIQASGDPRFDVNPDTATSFVWWNLVHGGMTNPLNSWTPPGLEANTDYFWRVRPRIQGDGKPVEWGSTWQFQTSSNPNSYVTSQEVPSLQSR